MITLKDIKKASEALDKQKIPMEGRFMRYVDENGEIQEISTDEAKPFTKKDLFAAFGMNK